MHIKKILDTLCRFFSRSRVVQTTGGSIVSCYCYCTANYHFLKASAVGSIFQQLKTQLMGKKSRSISNLCWSRIRCNLYFHLNSLCSMTFFFVPNLAIIVRRLRDAGYHWAFLFPVCWSFLLSFIPVLNIIAGLVSLPCSIA